MQFIHLQSVAKTETGCAFCKNNQEDILRPSRLSPVFRIDGGRYPPGSRNGEIWKITQRKRSRMELEMIIKERIQERFDTLQ